MFALFIAFLSILLVALLGLFIAFYNPKRPAKQH